MDPADLKLVGYVCNLVGVFFLANSIIFRRTRKVIEESFGVGAGSVAPVRDYSLNKIQVVLGFLFLNAGFLLQGFAELENVTNRTRTALVCLAIGVVAALAYVLGAIYSRRTFQQKLKDFFQAHPWDFERDMERTKEIGALLGVRNDPDATVADYVREVRVALELPPEAPRKAPGAAGQGPQFGAAGNAPSPFGQSGGRRLRDGIQSLPGR
ncbi:MAG: hypothetical protein AAF196_15335 [Planctomycetota bacterium]